MKLNLNVVNLLKRKLKFYSLFSLILFSVNVSAQTCGFIYSKSVTVSSSNVTGTAPHLNFPLLFSATDNNLRSVANGGHVESANGYDILFLDENGEQMAHELMSYDATTGTILAWVRIPKLYASFDTPFQIIYGNTNIATDQSSTAVWDSDYEAVLHLQETGNGTDNEFKDATINNHDGTGGGLAGAGAAAGTPTRVAGKFGFSQNFDDGGTADFIRLDAVNDASWTSVTVEAWVNPDDNGDDRVFGKSWGTGTGDQTWLLRKTGGTAGTRMRTNSNTNTGFDPSALTNGTWQHIAVTWNATTSELIVYRDGVVEGTTTLIGATLFTTPSVDEPTIGNTTTLDRGYDGQLQEARVSKTARSADWLATQFVNQNNPGSFYAIGTEQGGTYTPTIPTCGYSAMKVITINSAQVSGTGSHTDFPVLISLTDNDLRTTANGGDVQNANGYDIVFTDVNYVPYDFQIEKYNATTGEYVAWVRIPSLPTGTDLDINMIYGSSGVFADPSSQCVWSTDFEGVWHLHDDVNDASGNGQNGVNNGSTDIAGIIGDAQSFDGNDWIELLSFPNLTGSFTMSAWIRTNDRTQGGQRIFCDDELNTGGYALSLGDGGAGRPRFFSRAMNTVSVDGTAAVNNNTWYYITAVSDRTNQERIIYVNGVAIGSDLTDTGTWGTDNGDASIGGETATGETANRFNGRIDEVRVASTARSINWIITEYNNQNNPSSFYSVGSEVLLEATSTGNGDWDQTGIWSTGVVPGFRSNVIIESLVDLDDRDLYLCNLTIDNSNIAGDADLQIQNGHVIEVEQDVHVIGGGGDDATLRVMDNNSKLIVNRDLYMDHSGGDDIFIDVEGAGDSLIVRGDFYLTHDGGDNLDISVDNTTAVFLVEGNVTANMISGADDICEFDLNDGKFIVNGTFVASRSGDFSDIELDMDGAEMTADSILLYSGSGTGNDQIFVMVDQTSTLTTNYMYVEMTGADDFTLDVNVNAGTAGSLIVNGNLDIVKSGGDDMFIRVDDDNSLFHVTGDLTYTSTGGEELQIQINADATFDVDGDFNINHSQGQICHIFTQGGGASPTFNVDGNMTVNWNGGGDLFNPDLEGGNFNVGGNLTVNLNTGAGNVWFDCDGGNITVTDTFFLNHNGDGEFFLELDGGSIVSAGTLIANLDASSSGAQELLIDIDDDCIINVISDMELEANVGNDLEFHLGQNSFASTAQLNVGGNLTLDHNGAAGVDDIQFFLNDDSHVTITGDFIMETDGSSGGAGNFITRLNDNAILTVGSDLGMNNTTGSGFLEIELNDNTILQLGGNIIRNATPNDYGLIQSNDATTTIEYNGTGAQIFADEDGAGTDGIEYELVVINNSFGTEPQLTMEAGVTLNNSITFTDGVLQTTSVNLLTIGDNAVANGGNVNSYVSGPLQKEGDDVFVFPLGKNGRWARLEITDLQNGPAATDQYTAEYFVGRNAESFWDSLDYVGNPGGLHNTSIVEYWDLSRDNGNTQPKVTLYFEDGTFSYIDNLADLRVAHLSGASSWTNEGGTASGTVASGSVTSLNNITSFSVFTFGSVSGASNPLPVELLSFDGEKSDNTVLLKWTTLSEINNQYFAVERSDDGLTYNELGRIAGSGNSRSINHYSFVDDDPIPGYAYYRLKQVDYDGTVDFSKSIVIHFGSNQSDLLIYPNPMSTDGSLNVLGLTNQLQNIQILSMDGKVIGQPRFIQNGEKAVVTPTNLAEGFYLIRFVFKEEIVNYKLLIH